MNTLVAGYNERISAPARARREAHAIPASRVFSGAMHPFPVVGTAVLYGLMLLTFILGFRNDTVFAIVMGVNVMSLAAFAGLLTAMARQGKVTRAERSVTSFLNGYFDTGSGPVSGLGAFVLVLTVPVCLTSAAVAMAIIFNVMR